MDERIELLAPAGSFDALIAAVENGADAVYLGGKAFNARRYADNFDNQKLKEAVEYAHLRNVKVYITLNTLLTNRELEKLTEFLIYLDTISVDGVIVQDLGVAKFIKDILPNMNIHASTQMTIHNIDGVKALENLGFERVVLARELTIDEVEHICKSTSMEVEIFIHGALCVCYSGQCLMSSLIGGRSGNRGGCAQPCRLQYYIKSLDDSEKSELSYLLSPKDLCTLSNIGQIIKAGVKSLKIEGRMKRPEYVAAVVQTYRKYIEEYYKDAKSEVKSEDTDTLLQIFNRGGFTKGYLFGERGKSIMSFERPNNWGVYLGKTNKYDSKNKTISITLEKNLNKFDNIEFWNYDYGYTVSKIFLNNKLIDFAIAGQTINLPVEQKLIPGTKVYKTSSNELISTLQETYKSGNARKISIFGKAKFSLNEPIFMEISDGINSVKVTGDKKCEKAINKALDYQKVYEQLNKLGNTPFLFKKLDLEIDQDISVPISEINNVRRNAIEKLSELKQNENRHFLDEQKVYENAKTQLTFKKSIKTTKTKISLYIQNIEQLYENISIDRVYIPIIQYLNNKMEFEDIIIRLKEKNTEVYLAMPRIVPREIENILKIKVNELEKIKIDGILTTGLGQEKNFRDLNVLADFSYNIFNNLSIELLKDFGVNGITLSPELNLAQLKEILSHCDIQSECIVYGRLPLMVSQYCPIGSTVGNNDTGIKCGKCKKTQYELVDRLNNAMPLICDPISCQATILNSKVLFLGEDLEKIFDVNPDYIRINATIETSKELKDIIDFHRDFLRNGRGVINDYKEYIEKMKIHFTKGHYFRGVE